ncbi:C4-dicarboxylic acid transporter DauA [compost metagenome]
MFTTLTTAVEVGLVLAVVLFVKRMGELLTVDKVLPDLASGKEKVRPHMVTEDHDCPQVSIFTVDGPLFFGASQAFDQFVSQIEDGMLRVVLIRMGKVPFMDTTGEANFTALVKRLHKAGITVLVSGLRVQPHKLMDKTGCYETIGEANFFENTGEALTHALGIINADKCRGCRHFAFRECAGLCGAEPERKPLPELTGTRVRDGQVPV